MTPAAARWSPVLDRAAAFLAVFALLLRLLSGGSGTGMDLFLDLLVWIALALWFGSRALGSGASWSFTGAEFALLALAIVALASALRSDSRLPAVGQAFRLLTLGLLFLLLLQSLGARDLATILLASLAALAAWGLVQRYVLLPEALRALGPRGLDPEFARRAASGEVFATFLGPNQFAGFLVLLLPLALGFLLDAHGRARIGAGVAAGLGMFALALTGSLGGAVALLAGAGTFLALWLTRERNRRTAILAGAVAGAALTLAALFTPILEMAGERSHSIHVRRVYWQAAGRTAAEAPVLGVGPDGFRDSYFRLKSDVQQEAIRVHNDYLQLLADTGVLGLAAFSAFLLLVLRRAFAAAKGADTPASPLPPWLVPAAAVAAFLGAFALSGAFDFRHAAGLALAWLAARFVLSPAPAAPVFTRIGSASGLVALLVHMTVDFDLYEPGLGATLFAALALAALLGPAPAAVPLPRAACAAGAIVPLLVAGPALVLLVPRALAADQEIDAARRTIALLERTRASEIETTQRISDAVRLSKAAHEHNPLEPEGYVLHARARYHEWDLLRGNARDERALAEIEGIVVVSLENAIALRPGHAPYHAGKAEYHRLFRRFHLEQSVRADRRTMALAQAGEHLRLALLHQGRAAELYPTYARGRYALARLLEESGQGEEAKADYGEALRLSDLAGRELENLDRLKLEPHQQARALKRLDRHADAQEALARWLEPLRREPDRVRRLRVRPQGLGIPPEELDDLLRPALEEALDALLR